MVLNLFLSLFASVTGVRSGKYDGFVLRVWVEHPMLATPRLDRVEARQRPRGANDRRKNHNISRGVRRLLQISTHARVLMMRSNNNDELRAQGAGLVYRQSLREVFCNVCD